MSDYQASWIPDVEEVEVNSDSSEDEEENDSFMSCEYEKDSWEEAE